MGKIEDTTGEELKDTIEELTLLLLFLTGWYEKVYKEVMITRSWKTYRFEVIDNLKKKGYITGSYKAKSIYFTEEGEKKAKDLMKKWLGK